MRKQNYQLFSLETPGDILKTYVVKKKGITQDALAAAMGVSRLSINQIINGRRSITADMALRLGKVLGTTAEFWLKLQQDVDLALARENLADELKKLPTLNGTKKAAA